jgi:hypothetical protein
MFLWIILNHKSLVYHLEKPAEFSNKQQTEASTPEMKVAEKL